MTLRAGLAAISVIVASASSLTPAAANGSAATAGQAGSGTKVDNRMQDNLRNLATDEETFLVDHNHYAGAGALQSQGYEQITLAAGQVVDIHLDHWAYCLAGRVARHRWFIYGSRNFQMQGPKRTDTCSPAAYPHAAGRLQAS